MDERKLIELLERLLSEITTTPATRVLTQLRLDSKPFFEGLGHEKLPKLDAFLTKRLPRAL
jgi:hypothetical protein